MVFTKWFYNYGFDDTLCSLTCPSLSASLYTTYYEDSRLGVVAGLLRPDACVS